MTIVRTILLLALASCVNDGGDDDSGPGPGSGSSTYSNRVHLECNGRVLVDRTFTSKESCESFRDSNDFYCASIKLPISC